MVSQCSALQGLCEQYDMMLCCVVGGYALKQSGWKDHDALVIVAKYANACLEKMHFVPLACQVAGIICCGWEKWDLMEDAEQRNVLL